MNPIKNKMNQLGVSFTELQQASELSKSTIARVLKDDKLPDNTRVSTLSVIAETLECDISDFFPAPLPEFKSANSFGLKIKSVKGADNLEKVQYNCLVKYNYESKLGELYFACDFFRDKQRKYFKDIFIDVKDDISGVIKTFITEGMYTEILSLITKILIACDYPFLQAEKEKKYSGTIQYTLDGQLNVQGYFVFNTDNLIADHFTPLTFY